MYKSIKLLIIILFFISCSNTNTNLNKTNKKIEKPTPQIVRSAIYPGCEKYDTKDYRKCFDKKIYEHIAKYFNAELVNTLDLPLGKKKINVFFEVDKKGKVNILSIKAPHKEIEKEIIYVFKKLPLMKAGTINNKASNMKFNVPIIIYVKE